MSMTGADELALQLSGLCFRAGGVSILSGIDLQVGRGEFVGIIGPNGAGKTTLFNLISGLLRPSEGTMLLAGRDLSELSPAARARLGIGRTFQTSLLFGALSVAENARLAARARLGGSMRWWHLPRANDAAAASAQHALEAVGLVGQSDHPASSLSHGDKRKLELAVMVASEAEVILLDEPMAGVNTEDVPRLVQLIAELHSGGRTVLMVEHHMPVVLGLAQRVAVLHHGQLLACGEPETVIADDSVQAAYLGDPL
jgi:branched-chain amino acid transport system ATP-binding protein